MSGRRQLLWFTLIHPLVDACSVSVLVAGGMTWGRAMAYNAIAFALQLPLGVALDFMRPEVTARCFWLGTCAVSAAAFAAALGFAGWGRWALRARGMRSSISRRGSDFWRAAADAAGRWDSSYRPARLG